MSLHEEYDIPPVCGRNQCCFYAVEDGVNFIYNEASSTGRWKCVDMTDTQQREAARQFFYKWNGKGREDEDARSYWIDSLQDILGVDHVTDRVDFEKKVVGPDGNTKGFTFVARQKRFTFDEDHFRVDLVMYNRLLRCFVLFDLKTEKLKHQDLGQMQMYVNYYDRYEKTEDENPTIGVLLCSDKNDAMVELTLPKDANIYAAKYELYLPDKKLLQKKLEQWLAEEE